MGAPHELEEDDERCFGGQCDGCCEAPEEGCPSYGDDEVPDAIDVEVARVAAMDEGDLIQSALYAARQSVLDGMHHGHFAHGSVECRMAWVRRYNALIDATGRRYARPGDPNE